MYINFDDLPISSRVWVYQSNRAFTNDEKTKLSQILHHFTHQWAAHQVPLKASFQIAYDQFIVLGVDEGHHAPSGCSIDTSVAQLKEIEKAFGVVLFDRTQVAYLDGSNVAIIPMASIKKAVETGKLSPNTLVFNNMIGTKGEYLEKWLSPASATWLNRYFKVAVS